jgi:hypothetical protein
MKRVKAFIGLTLMVESANVLLGATELRAGALKAWDGYVQSAESHLQARVDSQRPFLSVVRHLSINSLTTTLRQTRDAVSSLSVQPGPLCKESLR